MPSTSGDRKVAILLATRNGAPFLEQQLASLEAQSHPAVDIWASDDGSTDATIDILEAWQKRWRKGRVDIVQGPRAGFAENFRSMIRDRRIEADYYAFCDQDDVWEPDKLATAIGWIDTQPSATPLLFCSRTRTMAETGALLGHSPLFRRPASFRNALVQSIAGGNTMVLNRLARDLVALASDRSAFVSHDWWCYMIVTGAGGTVRYAERPFVLYRQHAGNIVGANTSGRARMDRLRRLLHGQFAKWSDLNIEGLDRNRDLLTHDAANVLDLFKKARRGNLFASLADLRRSGVYRQTAAATLLLWIAVAAGRM